jgi:hypothetical protein
MLVSVDTAEQNDSIDVTPFLFRILELEGVEPVGSCSNDAMMSLLQLLNKLDDLQEQVCQGGK